MPSILKRFLQPTADAYVFQPASELVVQEEPPPEEAGPSPEDPETEDLEAEAAPSPEEDPLGYAKIQAEAILREAREDADRWMETYKEEAMASLEAELEEQRAAARDEGYGRGYSEGMAEATRQAAIERDALAKRQTAEVARFLEAAARSRDRILDEAREELKDLALAIAEKVIQVSLKNSSDILLRMVDAATDTHKRCEWAHIYVADCDVRGKALTVPELTAALSHISDRVRVIPMADDESGTCIVELPDAILDASVSTQLGNIKEVLDATGLD